MIQDERLKIKEMYLLYLEDVPKHKWACKACKISEDTGKRWRDEDKDFADECEERLSAWVKKQLKKSKPEFQLERLLRNDFSENKNVDLTSGGESLKPILVQFIDGKPNNTNTS